MMTRLLRRLFVTASACPRHNTECGMDEHITGCEPRSTFAHTMV